ncbi:pyrophosphohydrolase domain-containing protein [Chitinophaga arvensicola]|uniref:Phosphoribosyl-ATP pyrophosphohydrolase n=1 Tax=Chitinophaga arvensicola TaxID=29529 RepID=A0A1I0QXH2_9BACT|nr:nucleoside triphosphate pyrophosphohydrolase family protein [Chitinophaga arvensicola]SEW32503.1 Phosphoribosyl-ATP pyrophosphohydrolase [Chitinophaga arvensicola]
MEDVKALSSVAEFHSTFRHPIEPSPVIPSQQRCDLRVSLIQEELNELKEAIAGNNMVEVADALCDLQYVLSGAILEFGLGGKFNALFNEVHRSNMSKACKSVEEAEQTIAHYNTTANTECYYTQVDDLYLVYRKSDNKTLKSVNYSAAQLNPLL